MIKKRVLALGLAAGLSVAGIAALAPAPAVAHIKWNIPGAACIFQSPANAADAGASGAGGHAYAWNGVTNWAGETHTVVCPVDRTNLYNTNGIEDLEVRVWNNLTTNPPSTTTVRCRGIAWSEFGIGIISMVEKTVVLGGNQTAKIDWLQAVNASAPRGNYTVECELPPGIVITGVATSEYNP